MSSRLLQAKLFALHRKTWRVFSFYSFCRFNVFVSAGVGSSCSRPHTYPKGVRLNAIRAVLPPMARCRNRWSRSTGILHYPSRPRKSCVVAFVRGHFFVARFSSRFTQPGPTADGRRATACFPMQDRSARCEWLRDVRSDRSPAHRCNTRMSAVHRASPPILSCPI